MTSGGRDRLGVALVLAAVAAAGAASAVLLFSSYEVTRERVGISVDRATGAGPSRTVTTRERAVDDLGAGTVAFLAFPVVVAAAPLLLGARRPGASAWARGVAAALLLGWVLLLAFGGGELYAPAAALLVAAAVTAAGSRSGRAPLG